jgi:hypothetical protein
VAEPGLLHLTANEKNPRIRVSQVRILSVPPVSNQKTGIAARLIVVGMTASQFTIANPKDAGMLDVVGFDGSAPQVMTAFARGEV